MILEAEELQELRDELGDIFAEVFPDLAVISRKGGRVRDNDAPDQFTNAPPTTIDNIPCRYAVTTAQERYLAGKSNDVALYTVKVPAGIDVRENDDLTVKQKGEDAAISLYVNTILKKSNALTWKLLCVKK